MATYSTSQSYIQTVRYNANAVSQAGGSTVALYTCPALREAHVQLQSFNSTTLNILRLDYSGGGSSVLVPQRSSGSKLFQLTWGNTSNYTTVDLEKILIEPLNFIMLPGDVISLQNLSGTPQNQTYSFIVKEFVKG